MPQFRYLLQHPIIALGNVLGIALGVAVFLAMQTGNRASNRAFAASVDLVAGKTQVELRAPGSGFDENVFPSWRADSRVLAATPLVEGFATLPDHPGEYLHILGTDLFTAPPFQTAAFKPEAWMGFDAEPFLARSGQVLVSHQVARDFGWKSGQEVNIEANGRRRILRVHHVVPEDAVEGSARAESGQRLVIMDIAWAQELFGMQGKLTAIQLLLHAPDQMESFLRAAPAELPLPTGAVLGPPANRSRQIQTMVEGFQLNLNALSMVSVLVGVFLVYNTIAASTVRRRKEIGILRALGASRGMVMRHFLAEALVLAIPGVLLGLWAGQALAGSLVHGVGQTLSSRYLLVSMDDGAPFDLRAAVMATAYGIGAALLGAWWPSREAASQDPVRALHPGSQMDAQHDRRNHWWRVAAGFFLAIPLFSLLAMHWHPVWAFAACLSCVLAFAAMVPGVASWLAMRAAALSRGSSGLFPLAAEAFERSIHRTGITMAALLSSVAMLVGVTTMVASFRTTVEQWIGGTMDADLYLAPAANDVLGMKAFMPDEALEILAKDPRLHSSQGYREEPMALPDLGPTILTAVDPDRAARFQFLAPTGGIAEDVFVKPGILLANESFARKHQLSVGADIAIPTPGGVETWKIAGIFRDYSDDRGRIFVNRQTFAAKWGDPRVQSIGFRLTGGENPQEVAASLRTALASIGTFSIYTRQSLRQRVLEIFDQTFAITSVLRTIAVAVAVIGVVLALLILVMERTREISLLRSLGASARQVMALYLIQAGWVGGVAALLGGLCGLVMAWLLVAVVNPAFFGWTIPLHPVWSELLWLPIWLIVLSMLAGLYPAWRAARIPIASSLRLE